MDFSTGRRTRAIEFSNTQGKTGVAFSRRDRYVYMIDLFIVEEKPLDRLVPSPRVLDDPVVNASITSQIDGMDFLVRLNIGVVTSRSVELAGESVHDG
jgi:hypothetical protein